MSTYQSTTRTNYFSVKDEAKFRELINKVKAGDEVYIFEKMQRDGSMKFAFGCYGEIYGSPEKPEEYYSEVDINCFLYELQQLVCEDDAIIITETGNEKLRYVTGYSAVITSKKINYISLPDDALDLAAELLGNKDFQTQLDY